MANNYCKSSSRLTIPKDRVEDAKKLLEATVRTLKKEDGECGVEIELVEERGAPGKDPHYFDARALALRYALDRE